MPRPSTTSSSPIASTSPTAPRARRRTGLAAVAVAAVLSLIGVGTTLVAPAPARAAVLGPFSCLPVNGLSTRYVNPPDELLGGRLTIPGFRPVRIGTGRIDWGMDPFGSASWRKLFLSLKWVESLTDATRRTGRPEYLARARAVARDFATAVPAGGGRFAADAWTPMYAGQRATVLTCVEAAGGGAPWLDTALAKHGTWLVANDPGDWNQGVDAAIGLLAAACRTGNGTWSALAQARFARMARTTIDAQGAVGEQAPGYLGYLLGRWQLAVRKLDECGLPAPAGLASRLTAARDFLAWSTNPAGGVEQLGDGVAGPSGVAGPTAALAFATSGGTAGTAPAATTRVYAAGYVFGRDAWAPFPTSTYWTQRFGPPRKYHGHDDHTSLTLWARGTQLLVDAGHTGYTAGRYRDWLVGPYAHNVAVAPGARFSKWVPTTLTRTAAGPGWFATVLGDTAWDARPRTRSTLVDTARSTVVVADTVSRATPGGWQQLWHLPVGARVAVQGRGRATADTADGRARLHLLQVALPGSSLPAGATTVVKGASAPIQGWVSRKAGERVAAPVVVMSRPTRSARFLTVLVAGAPGSVAAAALRPPGPTGTVVEVTVDGVRTAYRIGASGITR